MSMGRKLSPQAHRPTPDIRISTYKGLDRALRAGRMGTPTLVVSVLAACAPLTVVGGGFPVGYAVSGIAGLPLLYLGMGLVLALFTVGYVELSRHVHNAGAFYAFVSRGLGGTMGSGAAFTALFAYNSMQAGLYGMFGSQVSRLLADYAGVHTPWWVPALLGMAVVGALGALKIDLNARVLGVMLVAEVLLVLVSDLAFVGDPGPEGVSFRGWDPSHALSAPGLAAGLCFVASAFVGFESAPVYAEETRRPQVTVSRATYCAIGFTTVFYAVSCWAMGVATGPGDIVGESGRRSTALPFNLAEARLGGLFSDVFHVFLVTSLFAALLSFHNVVARYLFAMGRDGLLPKALGRTTKSSGAPACGSVLQSLIAFAVVAAFAVDHRDPVLDLFTWMGNLGALGVLLLMSVTSLAVVVFFVRRHIARALAWRMTAAIVSAVVSALACALVVAEFDVLVPPSSHVPLRWILPGLVLLAAVIGLGYGLVLRERRPETHAGIGLGNEAFQLEKAAVDSTRRGVGV